MGALLWVRFLLFLGIGRSGFVDARLGDNAINNFNRVKPGSPCGSNRDNSKDSKNDFGNNNGNNRSGDDNSSCATSFNLVANQRPVAIPNAGGVGSISLSTIVGGVVRRRNTHGGVCLSATGGMEIKIANAN